MKRYDPRTAAGYRIFGGIIRNFDLQLKVAACWETEEEGFGFYQLGAFIIAGHL